MSWRAASGLRNWLLQRLSAVYIVLFIVVFVVVWGGQPFTYSTWHAWVADPFANVALILFVLSLLIHAWIGVRDVILDYVHSVAARYVVLIVIALGLIGLALWTLRIVLLVGLSGTGIS